MIQINYKVEEKGWKKNFPQFKKFISKTVYETYKVIDNRIYSNISVSFLLTSNKKMKELNFKYRNKNKATNVLSFPMQINYDDNYFLGDIVLANQIILKESVEIKMAKYDYLCKMTIHGMLHLFGYDHETNQQFKKMNKFENLIFQKIKN